MINLFKRKKSQDKSSQKAKSEKSQANKKRSGYFLEWDGLTETSTPAKEPEQQIAAQAETNAAELSTQTQSEVEMAQSTQPEVDVSTPEPATSTTGAVFRPYMPPAPFVKDLNGTPDSDQAGTNFAPEYLIPGRQPTGRRRPGPSLNAYMQMTRQMSTMR